MNFDNFAFCTHAGCFDGSMSAVLWVALGGNQKDIHFSSPAHTSTDDLVSDLLDQGKDVILVDLSISLELAEKLDARRASIRIWDHHKSAIPLSKFDWCHIDKENKKCGCLMFYEYIEKWDIGSLERTLYRDLVVLADDYVKWMLENAGENSGGFAITDHGNCSSAGYIAEAQKKYEGQCKITWGVEAYYLPSMSFCNAKTLTEFRHNAKVVQVTDNGRREGNANKKLHR